MKENEDKKLEKWAAENAILIDLKASLEEFSALKDSKGDKEQIDILNAKIANLIEDNSWIRLEWSVIKRGKQSRQEGLEKIERKIKDRRRKVDAYMKALDAQAPVTPAVDAAKLQEECKEGERYFHWAYGEVELLAVEDDYVFAKILDRKGVRGGWAARNNAEVYTDDGFEEVKEFPRSAIGVWLFPEAKDVPAVEGIDGHKMFKK